MACRPQGRGAARRKYLDSAQPASFQACGSPHPLQSDSGGGGSWSSFPHDILFGMPHPTERGVNIRARGAMELGRAGHFRHRRQGGQKGAHGHECSQLTLRSRALDPMLNAKLVPTMAIRRLLEEMPSMNHNRSA